MSTPRTAAAAAFLPPRFQVAFYWCKGRGGYWKCTASDAYQRIEQDGATPWEAFGRVAAIVHAPEEFSTHA